MPHKDGEQRDDHDAGQQQDQVQRDADLGVAAYPYPPAEEGQARGVLFGGVLHGLEGGQRVGRGQALLHRLEVVHGGQRGLRRPRGPATRLAVSRGGNGGR